MLYFVLMFPLSYLVYDNFSVFPCFLWPWDCWSILKNVPLFELFDGFPTVRLGLWDFRKEYSEMKCLYYAMNITSHLRLNFAHLSKVVFASFSLVKLFCTPLPSHTLVFGGDLLSESLDLPPASVASEKWVLLLCREKRISKVYAWRSLYVRARFYCDSGQLIYPRGHRGWEL